jgi:hypothetical protein
MRHWSFWEWLAYLCLLLGAMILAADTGIRVAPELAQRLPVIGTPLWGFASLALVLMATLILVAREFGWQNLFLACLVLFDYFWSAIL